MRRCLEAGPELAVIASNFGRREPDWSWNLRANPACTVKIRRRTIAYRARPVEGKLWDGYLEGFADFYPTYREYIARAGRDVPIWVLESAGSSAPPTPPSEEAGRQCMSRISTAGHHRDGFERAKPMTQWRRCGATVKAVEQGAASSASPFHPRSDETLSLRLARPTADLRNGITDHPPSIAS